MECSDYPEGVLVVGHLEDRRVGRLVGLTEDRRVGRLEGLTEDRRVGRLEGRLEELVAVPLDPQILLQKFQQVLIVLPQVLLRLQMLLFPLRLQLPQQEVFLELPCYLSRQKRLQTYHPLQHYPHRL